MLVGSVMPGPQWVVGRLDWQLAPSLFLNLIVRLVRGPVEGFVVRGHGCTYGCAGDTAATSQERQPGEAAQNGGEDSSEDQERQQLSHRPSLGRPVREFVGLPSL
jgi:hypothetical protein